MSENRQTRVVGALCCGCMIPPPEVCVRAYRARDPRFDGRFYVGVRTTGVYCRPVCPAPTPKVANVGFYPTAAAAAAAGFRPCLRCRPETSVGTPAWLLVAGDEAGLRHVAFVERQRDTPAVEADWHADADGLSTAVEQLEAYFAAELEAFDLPLAPKGTPFQQRVWKQLQTIAYGATRAYGDVAADIGRAGASRAVGAANGRNPISIIVPCHRVIGHDGSLTGYGGGLDRKRALLALEAR